MVESKQACHHSPQKVKWPEGAIQLCQLHHLLLLEFIVVPRLLNAKLNDRTDLGGKNEQ